jgi:tetratricopeptide (TPR) repeat protein
MKSMEIFMAPARYVSCWIVALIMLTNGIQAEPRADPSAATQPANKDDAFTTARKLAAKGDHPAALAKYAEALAADPKNGSILAYRALSRLALKQTREAQQDVDEALRLSDKEPVVLEAAGQLKISQNQIAQGKAMFEKAAGLSPKTAGAVYTDLAAALSARKDPSLAGDIEAALKSAAKSDPPSPEALFQLGQAYANAGRQEGRTYLQRYVDASAKLPADQRDAQKIKIAKQLIRALDVVKSIG